MSGFEKMIYSCLLWVIAYFVTLYFTNKMGVGSNVLKHALKWLSELRKLCRNFQGLIVSSSFSIKSNKSVLMLSKIIRCQKGIMRLFTVYLYDDKTDKDVKEAKAYVSTIPEYCRKALMMVSEGGSSDVADLFKQIETRISSAEALVKKALEYDIKSEMLKI